MNCEAKAEHILKKLRDCGQPLAVFCYPPNIRLTKELGPRLFKKFNSRSLVGVYDERVSVEQLAQDLEAYVSQGRAHA